MCECLCVVFFFGMDFCFSLLVSALMALCCTGKSSARGPPATVRAFAGDNVVLPCTFIVAASGDIPSVEWSKDGLQPDVVFLYRDGCEIPEMKNPAFEYRTSFIWKRLKDGNISLRISNVQLSDAGLYRCMRLWKDSPKEVTEVELVVVALSEPKLHLVLGESGGVTVECETNCWLPEPNIQLLDDKGNDIPADDPIRDQGAGECFILRRRATLETATSRVTCTVHQPESNQSRSMQIFIPANCTLCWIPTIIVGVIELVVCGLTVAVYCFCKRNGKPAIAGDQPNSRKTSDIIVVDNAKDQLLLEYRDNIEQLTKTVADLRSQAKEGTIQQLHNNLRSPVRPVVSQHDQPTITCSPSRSTPEPSSRLCSPETSISTTPKVSNLNNSPRSANVPQGKCTITGVQRQKSKSDDPYMYLGPPRRVSCPASIPCDKGPCSGSSPVGPLERKPGYRCRTMSANVPQCEPNLARLQYRNSFAFQSKAFYNNRYSPLANLKEESDVFFPKPQ